MYVEVFVDVLGVIYRPHMVHWKIYYYTNVAMSYIHVVLSYVLCCEIMAYRCYKAELQKNIPEFHQEIT